MHQNKYVPFFIPQLPQPPNYAMIGIRFNGGAAVRKEDKELLDKLNKGFEMLKADPYWEELIAKHLNK